ncbi:t-SNARE [Mycena sp. CBHHK59/15]|nr:t-SNARE [Mycena sp. CBHHK59/15]
MKEFDEYDLHSMNKTTDCGCGRVTWAIWRARQKSVDEYSNSRETSEPRETMAATLGGAYVGKCIPRDALRAVNSRQQRGFGSSEGGSDGIYFPGVDAQRDGGRGVSSRNWCGGGPPLGDAGVGSAPRVGVVELRGADGGWTGDAVEIVADRGRSARVLVATDACHVRAGTRVWALSVYPGMSASSWSSPPDWATMIPAAAVSSRTRSRTQQSHSAGDLGPRRRSPRGCRDDVPVLCHQHAYASPTMATDKLAVHRVGNETSLSQAFPNSNLQAQRQLGVGQSHELTNLDANGSGNGRPMEGLPAFLAEVTSIQNSIATFNANVTRISSLHSRSLDAISGEGTHIQRELDVLATETRDLGSELKERIKKLHTSVIPGGRGQQEREIRQNSAALVRTKFTEALQTYQQVEQEYRSKSRQRVERQYRIVKPDATEEEITEVISGGQDQLTSSTRYDVSRSAYNEVQARAQDLKKLEQTLEELAQLFSDMAALVELQNETIAAIETTAIDVEANAAGGLKHTEGAVTIARSLRKKRWICFFIVLIVVIILAVVLAIEFTKK